MYGPSFESGLSLKLFKIFILSDILADYYTALVTSFRFVVIKENLGGFFTSDRLSGRILSPQSPGVHVIAINQLQVIIDY